MKKILFAVIVCSLFVAFNAVANEYKPDELTRCDGQKKDDFMDFMWGNTSPDMCDSAGKPINGTVAYDFLGSVTKIPYVNGKKDGIEKKYNQDGSLNTESIYKEGKKDGIQKTYNKDGSLSYEAIFKAGNLDGNEKHYYADGKLETDIVYKDGKRDGYSRAYYKDGTMFVETYYKDGKMDGIQTVYYYPKDKVLKQEKEYKDDQLISTHYYDENGKEVDEKTFTRMRM